MHIDQAINKNVFLGIFEPPFETTESKVSRNVQPYLKFDKEIEAN